MLRLLSWNFNIKYVDVERNTIPNYIKYRDEDGTRRSFYIPPTSTHEKDVQLVLGDGTQAAIPQTLPYPFTAQELGGEYYLVRDPISDEWYQTQKVEQEL